MVVDKYPIMFSRQMEVVVSKTAMLSDNREMMEFQDPQDRRLVTSLHEKTQELTNSQTPNYQANENKNSLIAKLWTNESTN